MSLWCPNAEWGCAEYGKESIRSSELRSLVLVIPAFHDIGYRTPETLVEQNVDMKLRDRGLHWVSQTRMRN
jgi:hypothetical protein